MSEFSVYFDEQNQCLRGKFKGKLTVLSLSDYVKEVQKKAAQANKRLVSDFTETELDISTIEIIGIPEMLASMGLDDTWKRAIVLSKKIDEFELYSVLANNKGYTVRTFVSMDEALAWLKNG
jgi:hypothetical protein